MTNPQGNIEGAQIADTVACQTCRGEPCPRCGGSGLVAEQHVPWATEYLGCDNCYGEPCPDCGALNDGGEA